MALRILINGGKGRMGQTVAASAKEMGIVVAASVDLGDDIAAGVAKCDVVIDFSSHTATRGLLELAVAQRKPVVLNIEKARDIVQDAWTCSIAKAKRDLGYTESLTLEEGIRNTVNWYRQQGWIK